MTSPTLPGPLLPDRLGDESEVLPAVPGDLRQRLLGHAVVEVVDDRLVEFDECGVVSCFGALALGEGRDCARLAGGHAPIMPGGNANANWPCMPS